MMMWRLFLSFFLLISILFWGNTLFNAVVAAPLPQPATTPPPVDPDLETARAIYTPMITRAVLRGEISAPTGFDDCITPTLGVERLAELRGGSAEVKGQENDQAALCLYLLAVPIETLGGNGQTPNGNFMNQPSVSVEFLESSYAVANGETSGTFSTGQAADITLSALGFNQTGGGLLFNHPGGLATDGTHLLLADTFNNRVLIWNTLPVANTPPDVVLGQPDFNSNNPSSARDGLNWAIDVVTDGTRVVVADTENNRVMIWNSFPTQNGQPADVILDGHAQNPQGLTVNESSFHWVWGVWTDGTKLVLTSTRGGGILIWNNFPTQDNQPADVVIRQEGVIGTPRSITSDGTFLMVGDHNARNNNSEVVKNSGNFVWTTFPTQNNEPFDFFMTETQGDGGIWLRGNPVGDGGWALLGRTLHLWDQLPQSPADAPRLTLNYPFLGGDYGNVVMAGGRLYVGTGNSNRIVVYNSLPTQPDQLPDFAIGSPDIHTNTLETHFIMSNPVPSSDGQHLLVSSGFDRKLYVWRNLPDQSGAYPDVVYKLGFEGVDNALYGNQLAVAGKQTVMVWETLPLNGELPTQIWQGKVGSIEVQDIQGVAWDDRYFYLADTGAGKIYLWEGLPTSDAQPIITLEVERPLRLSSDGRYLGVATGDQHQALIYPLEGLTAETQPTIIGGQGVFNQVTMAEVSHGKLIITEIGTHRVLVWEALETALAGAEPDAILGSNSSRPEIGQDKLYMPAATAYDGHYLWVGEMKFSERLLRFSPQ